MKVRFDNQYGEIPLENEIRSIFDNSIAGQFATNGNYYVIYIDHSTYKLYAITSETERKSMEIGRQLEAGEDAIFNGEKVRGITYEEEMRYNIGEFEANLDLWGNIEVKRLVNFEYSEWFGTDIYVSKNGNVYGLYPFQNGRKLLIMDEDVRIEEYQRVIYGEYLDRITSEVMVYWAYNEGLENESFKVSLIEVISEYEEDSEKFFKNYNVKNRN